MKPRRLFSPVCIAIVVAAVLATVVGLAALMAGHP